MLPGKFIIISAFLLCMFSTTTDAEDCNEDFAASTGSIVNSGFPAPYANDLDCYYTITTPSRTSVVMEIIYLEMEDGPDYSPDYIQIFDGPTTDSPLLGQYSGYIRNSSYIYASSNKAMIYFHTDYSITFTGFYIYFFSEAIPEGSCPDVYYEGDSGEISSPNYPNAYTKKADCDYSITTSTDTQIRLYFDVIDMLDSTNCEMDYIQIYDGPSSSSTSLGKYCGQGPINDIFATTNAISAHFHSEDSNNDHVGFHIIYSTDACSGQSEFTGDSGTISSPGYPLSNYPNNADCSYMVTTPADSQVFLRVNYIDLEYGGENCPFDYVRIYDGGYDTDFILGTLCGTGPYKDIQSSSNQVLLKFHSDYSDAFPGFSITFTATYV